MNEPHLYAQTTYLGFDGPPEPVRNLAGGLTGLWWLLIIAALICFGACEYMRRKSVSRRERQEKNRLGAAFFLYCGLMGFVVGVFGLIAAN
ncbi:hypothetical protein L612_002000000860 [Rhodococcus rhodochrous J38]|uniref:hypothetical protein n=1 Tax=Rhodococcus TaxID=1827 RepID=UPI0011ABD435|nr:MULTISPECIES: hypothetical protein [Rhodococcus]TWH52675.1 hypothetical protein L612_002000000860 [Rhodococcus rhodochrous J38]